jgi:hypothetical protein
MRSLQAEVFPYDGHKFIDTVLFAMGTRGEFSQ